MAAEPSFPWINLPPCRACGEPADAGYGLCFEHAQEADMMDQEEAFYGE